MTAWEKQLAADDIKLSKQNNARDNAPGDNRKTAQEEREQNWARALARIDKGRSAEGRPSLKASLGYDPAQVALHDKTPEALNSLAGDRSQITARVDKAAGTSEQVTLASNADRLRDNIPGTNVKVDVGDIPPDKAHETVDKDGGRVTVIPEITIYGDLGRSGVGTPFESADWAAHAALAEIATKSVDKNVEYAGNVYQNRDGSYSFSKPVTLGHNWDSQPNDSPIPANAKRVATYHSHAGGFNASDEFFSPSDKLRSLVGGEQAYLITPRGQMFKYTPPTLLTTDKRERYPAGRVTRLH